VHSAEGDKLRNLFSSTQSAGGFVLKVTFVSAKGRRPRSHTFSQEERKKRRLCDTSPNELDFSPSRDKDPTHTRLRSRERVPNISESSAKQLGQSSKSPR
jgi:hypothetical protein